MCLIGFSIFYCQGCPLGHRLDCTLQFESYLITDLTRHIIENGTCSISSWVIIRARSLSNASICWSFSALSLRSKASSCWTERNFASDAIKLDSSAAIWIRTVNSFSLMFWCANANLLSTGEIRQFHFHDERLVCFISCITFFSAALQIFGHQVRVSL